MTYYDRRAFIVTCWVFLNLFEGFSEVGFVLVWSVNHRGAHRHELFDNDGIGRIEIAGNEIGTLEIVERVLSDEIVKMVGATVDGHS